MSIVLSTSAITQGRSAKQSACQSVSLSVGTLAEKQSSERLTSANKSTYTFPHINQTDVPLIELKRVLPSLIPINKEK
jgi:hypothetical protein